MAKPIKIWSGTEWVEVATAIPNLSGYATTSALSAHESDTTSVHGIADTSQLATQTYVNTAISNSSPGAELGYTTSTTNAIISSTNSTVMSLAITAPGTPIIVSVGFQLFVDASYQSNFVDVRADLYSSSGTLLDDLGTVYVNPYSYSGDVYLQMNIPVYLQTRITPAAGALTLQLRMRNASGSGSAEFQFPGSPAAWMRVTKV